MNGVLVLSLENGMLLYYLELEPSFGLSTPCDPYQQGGFLYALYSSASSLFRDKPPLEWYTQEHVVWHFHENSDDKILITMSTCDKIATATAQTMMTKIMQVCQKSKVSLQLGSKQSVRKQINDMMFTALVEGLHESLFASIGELLDSTCQGCFISKPSCIDHADTNCRVHAEKIYEEWNRLISSTADVHKTDELLPTAPPRTSSSALPPITPTNKSVLSTIKKLFFKNHDSTESTESKLQNKLRNDESILPKLNWYFVGSNSFCANALPNRKSLSLDAWPGGTCGDLNAVIEAAIMELKRHTESKFCRPFLLAPSGVTIRLMAEGDAVHNPDLFAPTTEEHNSYKASVSTEHDHISIHVISESLSARVARDDNLMTTAFCLTLFNISGAYVVLIRRMREATEEKQNKFVNSHDSMFRKLLEEVIALSSYWERQMTMS